MGVCFPGGFWLVGGVPWGPKCGFPRIMWWWVFALEVCMGGLGGASRGAGGLWGPPCGGIFNMMQFGPGRWYLAGDGFVI